MAKPDEGKGSAIGIDVGGTKTAGGIVLAATGELRGARRIPTAPQRGGQALLDDATRLARELVAEARAAGLQVLGIGVGVAELVDREGNVVSAQTIPWRGVRVREAFASIAPGTPVVVEADARAAARGEGRWGAGRGFSSFFYVSVGTGIGSAFVVDGRPHTGARGLTGTLASGPTTLECPRCGALARGVLEEYASGPALVARYRARAARSVERAEEVLELAAAGDGAALEVVRSAATALGSALGLIVSVLDPEAVVVGGGLGSAPGPYWGQLVAATREHIWSEVHRGLSIVPAKHGGDAGVVGAACVGMG